MQNNTTYEYTEICDSIWQIKEDDGVYCTLVRGSELAVLIDTGFGRRNLRVFVEAQLTTPYMHKKTLSYSFCNFSSIIQIWWF